MPWQCSGYEYCTDTASARNKARISGYAGHQITMPRIWPVILVISRTFICDVRNMNMIFGHTWTSKCDISNMTSISGHIPDFTGTIPDIAGTVPDITGIVPDIVFSTKLRSWSYSGHRILITGTWPGIILQTSICDVWNVTRNLGHIPEINLWRPERDQEIGHVPNNNLVVY